VAQAITSAVALIPEFPARWCIFPKMHALFHASHNVFVGAFFTPHTGARGQITNYVVGEFDLALSFRSLFVFGISMLLCFLAPEKVDHFLHDLSSQDRPMRRRPGSRTLEGVHWTMTKEEKAATTKLLAM